MGRHDQKGQKSRTHLYAIYKELVSISDQPHGKAGGRRTIHIIAGPASSAVLGTGIFMRERDAGQWDRGENPETDTHRCDQLLSNNSTKAIQRKRIVSQRKVLQELDIHL